MIDQLQRAEDIYDSVIYTAQIEGEARGEVRGEARGKLEERLAIARKMLETGISVEQTALITNLSTDEIKKLMQ